MAIDQDVRELVIMGDSDLVCPLVHNELADALATLASMLPYPSNVHIDPLKIQIRERHGYCNKVEVEPNVQPWYHDIKMFLKTKNIPSKPVDIKREPLEGSLVVSS
ncbi:PREDICTED: uncharacterized protein LOC109207560 [Nicotiana attenuata]|uniref:uncharacterized protein LOC109207560 n=1 Tax=Nicotiana attenuata TaxID=49451 RepID=UPI000905CD66|nr:PREDICTED: uncharacterized protein LOC109207560 [Nicotiana attenuata]